MLAAGKAFEARAEGARACHPGGAQGSERGQGQGDGRRHPVGRRRGEVRRRLGRDRRARLAARGGRCRRKRRQGSRGRRRRPRPRRQGCRAGQGADGQARGAALEDRRRDRRRQRGVQADQGLQGSGREAPAEGGQGERRQGHLVRQQDRADAQRGDQGDFHAAGCQARSREKRLDQVEGYRDQGDHQSLEGHRRCVRRRDDAEGGGQGCHHEARRAPDQAADRPRQRAQPGDQGQGSREAGRPRRPGTGLACLAPGVHRERRPHEEPRQQRGRQEHVGRRADEEEPAGDRGGARADSTARRRRSQAGVPCSCIAGSRTGSAAFHPLARYSAATLV